MTKVSTGTGPIDIIHHIASKRDGLHGPASAPLIENMPRGAMRASPQERFTRAPASRAHPRPAGESHARAALSTPTCAMFSDSKMRPRIGLRQAEHRVSRQSTSGNGYSAQAWACNGRGNLHTHCRSRRRGRSSEPGREAGTHPWDEQGDTLSSAPLTGPASVALNGADGNRPTSARTFVARPAQVNEANSARLADHVDMRFMRHSNRKVERAHLPGLMEMFERALRAG